MPHYFALQARAIRENTVHIHGTHCFPKSETQIYLDIEGLPDNRSYYLIGALVVSEGKEVFHSYWADDDTKEAAIFSEFVEMAFEMTDYRVLHFGNYESVALKRMKARLPDFIRAKIDAIVERATNVASVIRPHVYFPLYTNGLKDVGRFLGFKWAHENATGLEAIIARKKWTETKSPEIKAQLLQYNEDDCRALKHVVDSIDRLVFSEESTMAALAQGTVINAGDLRRASGRSHRFRKIEFSLPGFDVANRYSYFDYQRQKIFVRTSPSLRRVIRKAVWRQSRLRPNKVVQIQTKKCISCGSKKISQRDPVKRRVIDLKFFAD